MIFLEILITIGFYLCLPFYFIERVIHGKSSGWKLKFGFCDNMEGNVIMLHGCSVGEITALETIVKRIKSEIPDCNLVLTTSTLTGQNVAKKKFGEIADYITYFPFDAIPCVNRFLSRIKPTAVFIAETEIWPVFASGCKKRNIPISIINGRISDTSYKSYKFARLIFKKIFSNYTAVYTQSFEDSQKFESIGMEKDGIEFMGNIKFGITKSDTTVEIGKNGYRIMLAGSTHKPENPIIIKTYKALRDEFSDLKLLIAPRHLERVGEIEALLNDAGINFGHRSKDNKFSDETDVIILDTLGELKNMYAISDVAYIGGSFCGVGGHNPLEASIWSVPVVSGDTVFNFKDIYSILTKAGAAKVVSSQKDLYDAFFELLNDKNTYENARKSCENVFDAQKGATDFVINKVRESLT